MKPRELKFLSIAAAILLILISVVFLLKPNEPEVPELATLQGDADGCRIDCSDQLASSGSSVSENRVTEPLGTPESLPQQVDNRPQTQAREDAPGNDLSFFFLTESEYREVSQYWSNRFKANRASWVSTLEQALNQDDEAPDSTDREALAIMATLANPGYLYEPQITESDVVAVCRNGVCKVEVPASFKSTPVRNVRRANTTDVLHPIDRVLFDHGFGHHVSQFNTTTGIRSHYFLANGFELRE